jgi:CRISPR/Cas system CSM-associated protein Csm4 (group 5 of RAMP superfamily)
MSNYGQVYATASMAEEKYPSDVQKKIKRPGFLARWFLKKLMEGAEWEKRRNQECESAMSVNRIQNSLISKGSESIDQPERAIQFTVYSASGGRVVETRRYDKKTDRSNNGLYIIANDQDFGHEIDKIITMEALR